MLCIYTAANSVTESDPEKLQHCIKVEFYDNHHYIKALILKRLMQFDAASQEIDKAIEQAPENAFFLAQRSSIMSVKQLYRDSIESYKKALKIYESELCHSSVATTLDSIGINYGLLGNCKAELKYAKKALEIRQKLTKGLCSKNDLLDLSTSHNHIGNIYRKMDNNNLALKHCHRAYQILEDASLQDDVDSILIMNNLILIYGRFEEYEPAIKMFQKALKVCKKIYENEFHPSFALLYSSLGVILCNAGGYKEALTAHSKAYNVLISVQEDTANTEIADSLYNIANMLHHMEEYEQALEYHFRCLKLRKELIDSVDPRGFIFFIYGHISTVL